MHVLLYNKPRKTKIKTSKGKIKFCNADANVSADADAQLLMPIFPNGAAKLQKVQQKIQVQEIESEHYSY